MMSQTNSYTKFTLLSIDAWRDDYAWSWNAWYELEDDIFIAESETTPRKILAALRKWGYLTDASKGRLSIEDDGYNIVIHNKNTFEPMLALNYGRHWEFNEGEIT
jgi:hypothetical protein